MHKEIEEGAEELIFGLVQREQYRYPIPSAVRELASNGLDAVREKNIAREILTGKAKVEEYYVPKPEKGVYKDSGFKPEYYDLNWLSDEDYVDIIYKDNGEMGKDTVTIRDHGVGLGGKRLEKSFNLGFSTKRLNKFTLGKFGLGAKSGLAATASGYYTLTSRYNGEEFAFNVYEHKWDSIVPAFDLDTRQVNKKYVIVSRDGREYPYYSRPTTEKNGVEITIPVKKHHRQQYIDAVKSQLLYFPNIRLFIVDASGIKQERVQADIMYEDDLIVLSNNNQYSKPHLLLNGVNYGYIDFRELELEEKLGNIGIKIEPEAVTVNPSRESLIWDDKTRETVVAKFQEVVNIAEGIINQELKETDFLAWLRICANISGRYGQMQNGSVVSRLSQIVSLTNLELEYPGNKKLKYGKRLFEGIRLNVVTLNKEREGSKTKITVERRSSLDSADLNAGLPFIIQQNSTNTSNRKDKYILMRLYPQGFVQIHTDGDGAIVPADIPLDSVRIINATDVLKYSSRKETAARVATIQNYIIHSKDYIKYEDIEVPEDFKGDDSDLEIELDESTEEAKQSAEARRKLEGKTVLATPRPYYSSSDMAKNNKCYEMEKVELKVEWIDKWMNEEVFYSSMDYEPLLHTAALMTRPHEHVSQSYKGADGDYTRTPHFDNAYPVRLIRVAKDNVKYYKDFKHITKFFKEIRNKTITMGNALIRWNTARIIAERLDELKFLNGFAPISREKALQYQILKGYVEKYWRDLSAYSKQLGADDTTTQQLVKHCDNVMQFQLFVRANPTDTEAIAQIAQQLFNPQKGVEINDGCAIDLEKYDMFMELLDWAQPVRVMMNEICLLTKGHTDLIEPELEDEIRRYFQYRNCPL